MEVDQLNSEDVILQARRKRKNETKKTRTKNFKNTATAEQLEASRIKQLGYVKDNQSKRTQEKKYAVKAYNCNQQRKYRLKSNLFYNLNQIHFYIITIDNNYNIFNFRIKIKRCYSRTICK